MASRREREGVALRLEESNSEVGQIVDGFQARGFKSSYLLTYVVVRINPVRFHRAKRGETVPAMSIAAALTRMAASVKKFDAGTFKQGALALVAAIARCLDRIVACDRRESLALGVWPKPEHSQVHVSGDEANVRCG